MKAPMIKQPPTIAAGVSGEYRGSGRSWSTRATIKMVKRAATEERTGEVREIRVRKEPEKTTNMLVAESRQDVAVSTYLH